ncbi:MAG: DUF3426 domain-containing protein [Cellvibrionaceae bacterium]
MPDSASDTNTISDIVTRCPQCNTAFRVTPNQLAIADGVVRCGSCLAVFKAVDYKTTDEAGSASSSKEEKSEETLIDDDEAGLELNDDIYDLDTDNKSKKTSLFDRKLQPISQHTRESADESWALDMLADLDDDDIEPIKISRPRTEENTEPSTTAKEPETLERPEAPVPTRPEPKINKQAIEEEPPNESIILKDTTLEDNSNQGSNTKKKRGFSFFKRKDKKTQSDTEDLAILDESEDIDELNFDFDETYEAPNLEPLQNTPSEASTAPKPDIKSKQADDNGFEALYFEDDDYSAEGDTETLAFSQETDDGSDTAYATAPDTTHDSTYSVDDISSSQISDEEIEDAMHSKTSYANEQNDYLSRIQPAPVEMEWYESERTQRWLWMIGATLFSLALLIQVGIFRFETLSKNPSYRPYYETACKLVGCQLPNLIDTKKIRATNLVVRSHPSKKDVLIIDAILINNASFTQPYPALRLEFSGLNNQLIASRDLQPNEYLRGELAGARQMPANQPIQLSLSIIDPGETAVNYQLNVIKAQN